MSRSLIPRAPDAALRARAKLDLGFVPTLLDYIGGCPWLARAEIAFYAARPVHLSNRVCELVPYAVALDRGCRHHSGAMRAFLRLAGYEEPELRRVETGSPFAGLGTVEDVALDHAVAVARAARGDTSERLSAVGYGSAAIAELTGLAALVGFGTSIATPLAIPPDTVEIFERSLLGKLLRPLVRRRIRAARKPPAPPPTDADHGAMFPAIVALVAGSPLHTLARDVLADAWRSPILPQRDKAFIAWSVADALGARTVEIEATRLVGEQPSSRDDVLAAYVRSTVTDTPAGLQACARELAGSRSRPELLEVVGLAALANAIGRVALFDENHRALRERPR